MKKYKNESQILKVAGITSEQFQRMTPDQREAMWKNLVRSQQRNQQKKENSNGKA